MTPGQQLVALRNGLLARVSGNRYDLAEAAGACGDLGTLIPFILGYIAFVKMDPAAVLLAFGLNQIAVGLYYRTPMPVQPMKAIGTTAISQATTITPAMVYGASLVTALIWLVLGLTGTIDRIARLVPPVVVRGIVLGLGLTFMLSSLSMMGTNPLVAILGLGLTFLLLANSRVPAMFVLLLLGLAVTFFLQPDAIAQLANIGIHPQLPTVGLPALTWSDLLTATLVLALPQVPLSLGNACIAIVKENNDLFPDRPVTERKVATSMGLMNVLTTLLGGPPVCHGAGGMAGHVRFGARTGGAMVLVGLILVVLGLFFANSIGLIFAVIPSAILGVILFFAGTELALAAHNGQMERNDFYVIVVVAGLATWNMGIAFIAGIVLYHGLKHRLVRL